jgi:hypothetical protein
MLGMATFALLCYLSNSKFGPRASKKLNLTSIFRGSGAAWLDFSVIGLKISGENRHIENC